MHFAIFAVGTPQIQIRLILPFIFSTTSLEKNNSVTIMFFHNIFYLAVKDSAFNLIPVGSTQRLKELLKDPNSKRLVSSPCSYVRRIFEKDFVNKAVFGCMNDFFPSCSLSDTRVISN